MTSRFVVLAVLFLGQPSFAPPEKTPNGFCSVLNHLADRLAHNKMVIERGINDYRFRFPREFNDRLKVLDGNSHWIDAGAGEAQAMRLFAAELKKDGRSIPRLTALAITRPENVPLLGEGEPGHERFRYLEGKVEDISPDRVGQADLITDLFGPFTYTDRMDRVLLSYLKLAKVGGLIVLSPSQDEPLGRDFRYPPLDLFGPPMRWIGFRRRITLESWLRSVDGTQIEHIGAGIAITRTAANIRIPEMQTAYFIDTWDVPTREVKLTGKFLTYP